MFYSSQASVDRINSQIAELEKLKAQIPNVQPITQNFQLAPQNALKYANNIDEVQREYLNNHYKRINVSGSVGQVAYEYSDKICLITMSGHITCSVYGVIYDSFDCRRREAEYLWIIKD